MRSAVILAAMQFLSWCLVTVSYRAISQADYLTTLLVDTLYSAVSFTIISRIATDKDSRSLASFLGYTIGGVSGTLAGIRISLMILGK